MTGRDDDLPFRRPRTLDNLAETHQRDLRRINDTENGFHSLFAKAGDGDCRIAQFRAAQRTRASALNQVAKVLHQFVEALPVRVVQRRRDEPASS